MNSIIIRKATPDDAAAILKVLLDSFNQFPHLYTDKAFAATTISVDEVIKRMEEGNIWVALKDNIIIGTVAVVKKEEDLYIRGMVVLPEARGLKQDGNSYSRSNNTQLKIILKPFAKYNSIPYFRNSFV